MDSSGIYEPATDQSRHNIDIVGADEAVLLIAIAAIPAECLAGIISTLWAMLEGATALRDRMTNQLQVSWQPRKANHV